MAEPALYQYRMRATWNQNNWSNWEDCTEAKYNDCIKTPLIHDWAYEARKLFAEPFDIEPPRFAKRLINQLRDEPTEQTALTDKWYDRSVLLEQEKFKLTEQLADAERVRALAVELERQVQEMTEILRNEREIMHRENRANAQHAGQMEYRNREAINQIEFASQMIDDDTRGLRFVKVLEQIKTTLTK